MVVAYVIVSRKALLQCTRKEDFEVRLSCLFDGLESFIFGKLHFPRNYLKYFSIKMKSQTHFVLLRLHTTPDSLKTKQMFSVHTAPEKLENATITGHLRYFFLFLLWICVSILACGGCARSTNCSQNLTVLPKRHNPGIFFSQLTKIKTMLKLLWHFVIVNLRIPGLTRNSIFCSK